MKFNTSPRVIVMMTIFFLIVSAPSVLAQGSPDFNDNVDDSGAAAPIDMFIYLGIAAGSLYGIKKIKK
ncbi:hypothetical protein ACFQ3R_06405 [Mesonia ostreae]|uniref:Uncharacterized protein n=1 Tax=Mesonia ostreae TaxID=861110 RepID=A0ABU2KH45_9FLAO|nr:hypothetical protein [Mesonia ostreae]MDT0294027.1 hypothetical protein [Mesonia ostreae]